MHNRYQYLRTFTYVGYDPLTSDNLTTAHINLPYAVNSMQTHISI